MAKITPLTELKWWHDAPENVQLLGNWLVEKGILVTAAHMVEYFSKTDYSEYNVLYQQYCREKNPVKKHEGVEQFFDSRLYTKDGRGFLSVTTITGMLPNPFLTKIIGDLGNEEMGRRMELGGYRGSRVHQAFQDNAIVRREHFDDEEWRAILMGKRINDELQPKMMANELVVYSDSKGYAGRLDRLVLIEADEWGFGRPTVHLPDFKTGKHIGDEAWLQLAALRHALQEQENIHVDLWGPVDLRAGKYRCIADRKDVKDAIKERGQSDLQTRIGIIEEAYNGDVSVFDHLTAIARYHFGDNMKPRSFPVFPVPKEVDLSIPIYDPGVKAPAHEKLPQAGLREEFGEERGTMDMGAIDDPVRPPEGPLAIPPNTTIPLKGTVQAWETQEPSAETPAARPRRYGKLPRKGS